MLRGRYLRSLVGIKITDAPGPQALRERVEKTLPPAHRIERQVVQKLDAEFSEANFRDKHDQMVNGGWRFQIRAGGKLHDVVLTAHPHTWRRDVAGTSPENDGKGFERSAETRHRPEPDKTSLTTSEAGVDLPFTIVRPVAGRDDLLGIGSLSVKAGGATHAADTSAETITETAAKTTLTGRTDTYVSAFRYEAVVIGPDGRSLPQPNSTKIAADVTAQIARPEPDDTTGTTAGANTERDGRADSRPLDITGLEAVRDQVFGQLPREARPDGTAHNAIIEFLTPKNVLDGYEHASGWGLTSKRLDLSDGGHAWLRLTLEPDGSTHEGTVSGKDTLSAKSTAEHSTGRTDNATWSFGGSGGGAHRVWKDANTKESTWLTLTGGYTYAHSQAHQEKGKQTFSLENSIEHTRKGDLIATKVRFRVEVLHEQLSPGTDGLYAVRPVKEPAPAVRDEENPPALPTGEVVTVRPRPVEVQDGRGVRADAPHDLREPLTAHRTAYVDFPGSTELERHITGRLSTLAPGILPPPGGGRTTPQAMENQRILRERLSPSALRSAGDQLLGGTFRITLDASHLPGLPGRTYEAVIRADLGGGTHHGPSEATENNTVTRAHSSDKAVTRGDKHTLGMSGNVRRALNPLDTVRVFGLGGGDGSYGPARQIVDGADTQVKRGFQHRGEADVFGYPVTYSVMVGPHQEGTGNATQSAHGSEEIVRPAGNGELRVEVRRPEASASAPRYLRADRLPQTHIVLHVADEAGFGREAEIALRRAYEARDAASDGPDVPDLSKALESLSGQAQLRSLVSASHAGWANTHDQHVGAGRNRDTVGLSVRTRLRDLAYKETLPGDGTLELEVKSSGSTTLADQWSASLKGNLGPDAGRFPETPAGELTTSYQVRGGARGKFGYQWDGADTFKQQTSTTRKVSHKDTWHVYEAMAEISVAGRVTDAKGVPHVGAPVPRTHKVLVLLSDEDVARLKAEQAAPTATTGPAGTAPGQGTVSEQATPSTQPTPSETRTAPELRRATLLEQGVTGGALADVPGTDAVLKEIDEQLRGRNDDMVPVAALPFADTYSPDNLAANFDALLGPGILDRHVQETRAGRTITEVLVRGVPDGWRDDGERSDRPLTREVSAAQTVKGKAAGRWSLGAEATFRAAVMPPLTHMNAVALAPRAGGEGSRGNGAESGVTTTVGHKTSGFGDVNARFSTDMRLEVTVTRRTETGRFVNLPKPPEPVAAPSRVTVWVPESLTEKVTSPPHPRAADVPDHSSAAASAARPDDIELGLMRGAPPAGHENWQVALREAHDLVGFDNTKVLHDVAVQAQATPRPWGSGTLGRAGAYSSAALSFGAEGARWAANVALPEALTTMARRVVDSFVADPRLRREHDLNQEQRLTLEEQFAIRRTLSGQSLPAVFHQLQNAGTPYPIPGTSLALSMEAAGPAVELSSRDAADDELSVAVKDESVTAASDAYNWNVSPIELSVLTSQPTVSVPLGTGSISFARDQSYDSFRPVTRRPGTPGRPTPDTALPHGKPATDPGKAQLTGPQALMRQPVRITVHTQDDKGPYGTPRTVPGHVFYWTTNVGSEPAPEAAAPPRDTETPTEAPREPAQSSQSAANTEPVKAPAPGSTAPRTTPPGLPAESSPASTTSTASPAENMPAAPSGTVHEQQPPDQPSLPQHPGQPSPVPLFNRSVPFGEGETRPAPEQIAHIGTMAADVARTAVGTKAGRALPSVTITGHGNGSVSGQPHFGRTLQVGKERADSVEDHFSAHLTDHLAYLGSPLTAGAFDIRSESQGHDLPSGTDTANDALDTRHQVVVTVTLPSADGAAQPAVVPPTETEIQAEIPTAAETGTAPPAVQLVTAPAPPPPPPPARELSELEQRASETAIRRHKIGGETIAYLFHDGARTDEVSRTIGEHPSWVNERALGQWVVGLPLTSRYTALVALNKWTRSGEGLQGESLLYLGANSDFHHPLFTTSAREMTFVGVDPAGLNDVARKKHLDNVVLVMQENLVSYAKDGYTVETTEIVPGRVARLTVHGSDGQKELSIEYRSETYDEFVEAHPGATFDVVMDKDSWLLDWKNHEHAAVAETIGGLLSDGGTWIGGLQLPDSARGPFSELSLSGQGVAHPMWSGYEELHLRQKAARPAVVPAADSSADGGASADADALFQAAMAAARDHFLFMDREFNEGEYQMMLTDELESSLPYHPLFAEQPERTAALLSGLASLLSERIAAFTKTEGDFSPRRILLDLARMLEIDLATLSPADAGGPAPL
ncbi:hypothetical protein SLUN_04770 [Streptomyces lunaelactis]|uniref:Uncharacterized protein n=1 Tax=Streptomyces lunaelactis TaxID=1535768 RepID=A0A2R4SXP0_9ACTN|nr:hypothetical protein [Streptomyces lunaelactis]AVZ71604.1 hypothetical protein SLUN_04770 [Streptomyces lunaelactis]